MITEGSNHVSHVCFLLCSSRRRHTSCALVTGVQTCALPIYHPRLDWRFATVPQAGLDGRSIGVPRGKVLGGCSSTNGLLYVRGQREDYDDWAAAGNVGWSFEIGRAHV